MTTSDSLIYIYKTQSHLYCINLFKYKGLNARTFQEIFKESREKTVYLQENHISKSCLPYKIPYINIG